MKSGHLVHRTRRGRVRVKPDLIPELISWLAMRKIQARRAIETATVDVQPGAEKWAAATVAHYRGVERSIDYLVRTVVDSMPELEFDLVHAEAKTAVALLLAAGIPVGGVRPEVPSCVPGILASGRGRRVGPRHDRPQLSARTEQSDGTDAFRDSGPDRRPTPQPERGGSSERGNDSAATVPGNPGRTDSRPSGKGGRKKRTRDGG